MTDSLAVETMTMTIDADGMGEQNLERPVEDQAWWDAIASIDTSQPEIIEFLETYIEQAGVRRKDRRVVVERFILWQQGVTFEELVEMSGIGAVAVRTGVRQVGHVLMGTPMPGRRDRKTSVDVSFNLTEIQWRDAILEAGLIDSSKANYKPADKSLLAWQDDSLCAQEADPDSFIVEKGDSVDEQIAVCESCRAQLACLAYALVVDQRDGAILGGKTERQRTLFRNKTLRGKAV